MHSSHRPHMISTGDLKLPDSLKYPGKLNRNNKCGTLLSRPEWLMEEGKKWITHMKYNDKYDNSYHSVKAKVLHTWLLKTFKKVSWDEVKKLLYDLEANIDDDIEIENSTNANKGSDSDSDANYEYQSSVTTNLPEVLHTPNSPDMFEQNSDIENDIYVDMAR